MPLFIKLVVAPKSDPFFDKVGSIALLSMTASTVYEVDVVLAVELLHEVVVDTIPAQQLLSPIGL